MTRTHCAWLSVWAVVLLCPAVATAQNDLARARALYNAGQYDEAISAATIAVRRPVTAPSATLIIARSRLERFRQLGDPHDIATARAELVSLNPRTLGPQEAIEWQIGVGTALFLENQIGPAAEMFHSVLQLARTHLPASEYEKLLEWWSAAQSRLAEGMVGDARRNAYERLLGVVRLELDRNPLSRPSTYWTVVASRGAGDFEAAWGAAVAGWIRAGGQPEGESLRADLERFVTQTLIPERAQAGTGQRLDSKATLSEIAVLAEEWRAITNNWKN